MINKIDMKKITLLLAACVALATCKPKIEGELGEPFSKIEGISGTWKINTFEQRDENNPIKETRDFSSFYVQDGVEPTHITFQSSNMTYNVVQGPGKNYFGTGGTWHFDNNDFPSEIYLESSTDTLIMQMGTMPRVFDNSLDLELHRYCEDATGVRTPTVTYIFNIQRVQ
jgi:hypothetical protein